jgi:endoglycosylceramidase
MRCIISALVLALCLSCASGSSESNAALQPYDLESRRVFVDGDKLVDIAGRQVVLRGVNVGGRAKLPPFIPFDFDESRDFQAQSDTFFDRVRALGAGVVRLTLSWEGLEPERGTWNLDYLDQYTAMMNSAHERDIAVIVDFHQDAFARAICGDGFPLWTVPDEIVADAPDPCPPFPAWGLVYLDPTSAANRAFQRLWEDRDGLQDDFERFWRFVASSLASHPALAAFEIINEPPAGTESVETFEVDVLPAFYDRIGAAIVEEAGAETTLMLDGRAGDALGTINDLLVRPDLPAVVYAPHFYDPIVAVNAPMTDPDRVAQGVRNTLAAGARLGAPVILGEFGAQNTYPSKGDYLRVIYEALDASLAHGAMWDVTQSGTLWNGENFSALAADGSERDWVGEIDRAVPRAVSGEIVRFDFDPDAVAFDLEVTSAGDLVSEIYLPVRHFGDEPGIEISGEARWRWLPDRSLLLVQAEPGTSYSVHASR